jgi:hypothetical protein
MMGWLKRVMAVAVFAFGLVGAVFGQGLEFSGVLDSTVNYTAGVGGAPAHSWGIEEYANLRLRARAGEKGVFYGAFNVTAVSGNYLGGLTALAPGTFSAGANYAAAIEPERLYFRYNGDLLDAEAGLLRLAFGYGQTWNSSDFLNPRNPLFPNARPRGVLGTGFSLYPSDGVKILLFAAAPKDPLESGGGGFLPGFSLDRHWERLSLQALYAYETPREPWDRGLHRFGLSLKGDLELGLTVDMLYTLNPASPQGPEGLSAGAGFDYSFFEGRFYFLAEYLFNGSASSTALGPENSAGFSGRHFLYWMIRYSFNDYASLSLAEIFCLADLSFTPILRLDYELFQGLTLNLSARVPLDKSVFGGGGKGEMGPENSKTRVFASAGARLRF